MAGQLPGVECARRRRLHQGGSFLPGISVDGSQIAVEKRGTRHSSFCLHTGTSYQPSSHQKHRFQQDKGLMNRGDTLAQVAREAKERLDERLKTRGNPAGNMIRVEDEEIESRLLIGPLHLQVFGSKNGRSKKKFQWSKFGWGRPRHEECAVCLDHFEAGELLVHLPCAHYFHSACVIPWLKTQSICPCCRKQILLFEKPPIWD
ncbi:probable E3 ubiquitin-protein ligase RHY1A [Nymphaea colorata]|nr:probable E3 ubiquitin-protein ligase RHY1A [Nymphaea colorata]